MKRQEEGGGEQIQKVDRHNIKKVFSYKYEQR